ncbi:FAD-dependent oxidoreductase [Terriglobus saanensis]|uniref:Response regulator receiver protein n=1 Tax=Terriglobus saanensis (strain ATCC BAA-1853 / DSM 23119 / SP1PR4) TaxID=401053 RepID=E8V892_TERSS|nr:FAD-dependent oxidoreductase [Terriglobus saanensis]ADV81795.1 response regulator receiver protein [Terriglobus saanensis SP1PR4]
MPKPILFAIDDDVSVLEAVVGDLRRKYGEHYRILRAASGQAALDTMIQLKDRKESVALLLSDQRMPGMTGVEMLQRAIGIYPDAKRILLTAYADTEAAIRAINSAKIHYYLNKPWDPPEEKLYPVLDDLLENWNEGYQPPYRGVQVIGTRWGALDHGVRDFLSRNRVQYRWISPEVGDEAEVLLEQHHLDGARLPAVIFGDGTVMVRPSQMELAEKLGMRTRATEEFYDLIVIGAGPAGLASAVYGASEGLRTLILESDAPGGQAGSSSKIENYLGFPGGISGEELGKRAFLQAARLGAEIVTQRAECLRCEGQYRVIKLGDGREVSSSAVVIATGVSWVRLPVKGADRLLGAGVYYGAALAEAMSCKDEDVYVVGGANSAGQAAMYFAKYARSVRMILRGDGLAKSMSRYLIDQIEATDTIQVETNAEIIEMMGDTHLEQVRIQTATGEEIRPASSVFIFIGAAPKTAWLPDDVERDDRGFVLAGPDVRDRKAFTREPYLLETSVPGIFVAGDVRHGSVKRVASAVGEGSIAIQFVHQYLAGF